MTQKGLADGKASLESANQNCMQVAQNHEATVAGRGEELKAIAKAKRVLMETTLTDGIFGESTLCMPSQGRL